MQYEAGPLCVEHHLKHQQASWFEFAKEAAVANYLADKIAQGTGYLLPPNYINIPRPPSLGDTLTLNHINITGSKVGMVNTGIIKEVRNLDASISVFKSRGHNQLAESLREFTQLLWDSQLAPDVKEEIAQQLTYLAGQAQADPAQRSKGIVKSVLLGVQEMIGRVSVLAGAWSRLQPLFEQAFQ